jgi:hypothetical protein
MFHSRARRRTRLLRADWPETVFSLSIIALSLGLIWDLFSGHTAFYGTLILGDGNPTPSD